jgi:PAS domain S-box-containing protein
MWDSNGEYAGALGMVNDITARRAADALRAEITAVIGGSEDAVVSTTLDGRIRTWNPAATRIYGYSRPEALDQDVNRLTTAASDRARMATLHARVAGGEAIKEIESAGRRRDGTQIPLSVSLSPVRDPDGTVTGIARIARDISERVAAERRLDQSERRFRQIVETANEGVWTTDEKGVTTFANASLAEMLGYEPADIVGRRFTAFCADPDDAARAWLACERGETIQDEFVLLCADGTECVAYVSAGPLLGADGQFEGALAMVVDMTQLLKAEREAATLQDQLHQVQKLEIVGQLAGGVAHDFNNILAVILNYAHFAMKSMKGHPAHDDVGQIKHAAERAAALTEQLLLFSRRDLVPAGVLDVNELLTDMAHLTRRTVGAHIDLQIDAGADIPFIQADRSRMEQVLMNLTVNARDAMRAGGRLAISTRAMTDDHGSWLRLTVSDAGQGMTEEVRTRAFEPFFTTKPQGSGTGLGLSTVYGIVTALGGRIGVESQPGAGTTITVDIPATDERPIAAPEPASPDPRKQTVLVVEDESAVREITARILAEAGFQVLDAGTPSEALGIVDAHDGTIDLVLTDIVMPEKPGTALAEDLQRLRPHARVMFMSGYADRVNRLPVGAVFIRKPFLADALVEQVEHALAANGPA